MHRKLMLIIVMAFLVVDEIVLPTLGLSFRPSPLLGVSLFLSVIAGFATAMALSYRKTMAAIDAANINIPGASLNDGSFVPRQIVEEEEDSQSLYHVALVASTRDDEGGIVVKDRYTVKDYKVSDITETFLDDIPADKWLDWSVAVTEYKPVDWFTQRNQENLDGWSIVPQSMISEILTCARCYGLKATCGH